MRTHCNPQAYQNVPDGFGILSTAFHFVVDTEHPGRVFLGCASDNIVKTTTNHQ
jgi:hypothetical protein